MKHVSASEARKNWFKLLDEAAQGEVIGIQRSGRTVVLRAHHKKRAVPSYAGLVSFPDADEADTWGWAWTGPGRLVPKARRKSR